MSISDAHLLSKLSEMYPSDAKSKRSRALKEKRKKYFLGLLFFDNYFDFTVSQKCSVTCSHTTYGIARPFKSVVKVRLRSTCRQLLNWYRCRCEDGSVGRYQERKLTEQRLQDTESLYYFLKPRLLFVNWEHNPVCKQHLPRDVEHVVVTAVLPELLPVNLFGGEEFETSGN